MGEGFFVARRRRWLAIGVAVGVAVAPSSAVWANGSGGGHGGSSGPTKRVIATGLVNPRGVTVGLDGSVYVAESGAGGDTLANALIEGEPSPVCLGNTGGVTRVRRGQQSRVATFPSLTEAFVAEEGGDPSCDPTQIGAATTGPSDVAWQLDGSVLVTVGLGGNGDVRSQLPAPFADSFGKLFSISRRGNVSPVADITGFEDAANPTGDQVDSNPYGVTTFFGTHYVADAGGNDIVKVDWRGRTSALATFPLDPTAPVPTPALSCGDNAQFGLPPAGTPIPPDFVPTSVTIGPDGFVYAAQLTGFPFASGVAKVYRINPWTGAKTVFAQGFTNIVGIAFGPDRSLYVLEITRNGLLEGEICGDFTGALFKVRNGTTTEIAVPDGLSAPGGIAVGLDSTIYVSNNSVQPGGAGELLAIRER